MVVVVDNKTQTMHTQKVEGQLRHLLTSIGALLVFAGFMEVGELDEFYQYVEMGIGSVLYLFGIVRSWTTKVDPKEWYREIAKEVILHLEANSKLEKGM